VAIRNAPGTDRPIAFLKERAKSMRRHMLRLFFTAFDAGCIGEVIPN
jgi:hypothetical protein